MMWLLGSIFGGSVVGMAWLLTEWHQAKAKHQENVRDWQREHNGYAIIRSRHRRADRHKEYAPLPLDLAACQMQRCGQCRVKRIGGEWS